jgi:ATP-dependent DNA ligase
MGIVAEPPRCAALQHPPGRGLEIMSAETDFDLKPMEARSAEELPTGGEWQYEPKWDGFRCLAFKDGGDVKLIGKSGKSLGRYFPEIVEAFAALAPRKLIIDGEIILELNDRLSFDVLQMRLHPAASRIAKLASETPARFVAFDCLTNEKGRAIPQLPFLERRRVLEQFFKRVKSNDKLELTPCTTDRRTALGWLNNAVSSFDGVVAKRLDLPYRFGERATLKVKRLRTADCVVGGFRYEQGTKLVGSLLLGLYDDDGLLQHVGFMSSIAQTDKPQLTKRLEKLISPPGFTGDAPGGPSRWSNARSAEWQPLRPKLVAEVRYDHVTDRRFRHGTKFLRWRPDKKPQQCTFEQIERAQGAGREHRV